MTALAMRLNEEEDEEGDGDDWRSGANAGW